MDPVIGSQQLNIHSLSSAPNEDKWSVHTVRLWHYPGRREKAPSLVFHTNARDHIWRFGGDAESRPARIDSRLLGDLEREIQEQGIRNVPEALVCSLKERSMSPQPLFGECSAGHCSGNDTLVNIWWRDWGAVIQYSLRACARSVSFEVCLRATGISD